MKTHLQPGASNVAVLLVDDMIDVLAVSLDQVCHQDATQTSSNGNNSDLSVVCRIQDSVGNDIARLFVSMSYSVAKLSSRAIWIDLGVFLLMIFKDHFEINR